MPQCLFKGGIPQVRLGLDKGPQQQTQHHHQAGSPLAYPRHELRTIDGRCLVPEQAIRNRPNQQQHQYGHKHEPPERRFRADPYHGQQQDGRQSDRFQALDAHEQPPTTQPPVPWAFRVEVSAAPGSAADPGPVEQPTQHHQRCRAPHGDNPAGGQYTALQHEQPEPCQAKQQQYHVVRKTGLLPCPLVDQRHEVILAQHR